MVNEGSDPLSTNLISLGEAQDLAELSHCDAAIQLYTQDSSVSRSVNRALISLQQDLLDQYRVLIANLHRSLSEHHQQYIGSIGRRHLEVYRGMCISADEMDCFTQNIGGLFMSKSFMSTTKSLDIALFFTGNVAARDHLLRQSVLMHIEVDPSIKETQPFASIQNLSAFEDEEEILFAPGSVFRIIKVEQLSDLDSITVIHCAMIDESKLEAEYLSLNTPDQLFKSKPVHFSRCSHLSSL